MLASASPHYRSGPDERCSMLNVLKIVSIPLLGLLPVHVVLGQGYPLKPVRIVTSEAGGNFDLVSRTIAQGVSPALGQQVIVDNRAGVIAIETVAKAQPDGYTLLLNGTSIWLSPFMRSNVAWDPVADFAPVTLAVSAPNILVVHPALPARSVEELIALARAKPGTLNYGSTTPGGSIHLAGELFNAMAGVNIVRVPYRGEAAALNALFGGSLQLMFNNVSAAVPHVKAGRLRALAVTSARQSALLPGVPTVAASGLPGYQLVSITGIFAPARTPAQVVTRLHQEIVGVLSGAEVRERLFNVGVEVVGSSPAELAVTVKAEMERLGKLIKDAGIRAE